MFAIIARYRARKSFKDFGYDQDRNPYKPKITYIFEDLWNVWYWEHLRMHYIDLKKKNPNFDLNGSSFYEYWD